MVEVHYLLELPDAAVNMLSLLTESSVKDSRHTHMLPMLGLTRHTTHTKSLKNHPL